MTIKLVTALRWTINDMIATLQSLWHELLTNGPLAVLVRLDPRNINWAEFNYSFVLLFTAIFGFVAMAIAANLTDESNFKAPGVQQGNKAVRDGDVVHREGDPPIPPPTQITALRVYPIKSCRGFEIESSRLRQSGLTLDRNWMFIDKASRKFLTIRSDPSMTLIDTSIVDNTTDADPELKGQQMLQVSIHGQDARVTIPAFPSKDWLKAHTTLTTVEIWEEDTDAWEYSDAINSVFRPFFNKPVALVYKGPTARMVAVNGRKELYGAETSHHFADVMSLLIASEASIKDLNRRLEDKKVPGVDALTIERFRPNIIVRGRDDHPWEEDTWKRIRITTTLPDEEAIYKVDLDVVARCARCQVPNVNPDSAEKHPKEPWDELMQFRRVDTGGPAKWKPCFGMLCIPKNEGKVKVGAAVLEVLETTDKHLYNTASFKDL